MKRTSNEQLKSWIDHWIAGDKESFQELINHVDGQLCAIKRGVISEVYGGKQWLWETEDVLQDAKQRLLERCESLAVDMIKVPYGERMVFFLGCTARIIRDLLCEEARKRPGRRLKSPQPESGQGSHEGSEPGDFFAAIQMSESNAPERVAMWADFHEFINGLPEDLREVTDLYWYQGRTQAEVGEALGVSEINVRKRWAKVKVLALDRFGESPFK